MAIPRNSQLLRAISLIVTIWLTTVSAEAQTTRYIFQSDQSTLVQTGGIAGVQWTYAVEGEFLLTVDSKAGTASFTQVDANATDDSPLPRTLDPNEVFNMTALKGIILDDGESIRFKGSTDDASSILITLTFGDDSVKIKGQTTPPPGSADFFIFTMDAVARRAGSCPADYPKSSEFEFDPNLSTTTRTGGLAGVIKVYTVEGRFRLLVDDDTGSASFDRVDANLVDPEGLAESRSIDEYLNLSGLAGLVQVDGSILFKGNVHGGSDVGITLTCESGCIHLAGETIPPPDSADFPIYHLDAVACRKYAGGTGEPNDPYQIATAADLIALGETPEDYDKHFILTADINLDPNLPGRKVFDKAVIAPDINDSEYWFQGSPFAGIFDGNGHTISHLTINGTEYLGLFGYLECGTEVRDLGFVNVNVVGSGTFVGALAGRNGGYVMMCYSTGTVIGGTEIGGLIGENVGTISGSYTTNSVSGDSWVGGLVGMNGSARMIYNEVGYDFVEERGTIFNCYSTGYIQAVSIYCGGLVGHNVYGSLSRCYSIGKVSGAQDVGGLVGLNHDGVNQCFWDIETSGQTTSSDGTGKTTAEMQTAGTFLDAGWDFVDETTNGTDDIWWIVEGQDYPRLWWEAR